MVSMNVERVPVVHTPLNEIIPEIPIPRDLSYPRRNRVVHQW